MKNNYLKYFSLPLVYILIFSGFAKAEISVTNAEKYQLYRNRLLDEWIVVSPNVEQFGVNIPAVDRRVDSLGKPKWVSWSDGNSNFNHWFGILATEYRLLKNNNQDYHETLSMLVYSLIALERLDLYSEYILRDHHGLLKENRENIEQVKYPDDINGFLLRDDVSLGFWRQYHDHFKIKYGWHNKTKDGTNTYLSVFQKGVIQKEGMSQDNIIYLLQSLALIKQLVDNESILNIEVNFVNNYIPRYLNDKKIIANDSVYFDLWINDITERLIGRFIQEYPAQKIVLKPHKGMATPSETSFGGVMSSSWYIMNPVTKDLVAEGSGEDMGVWMNSYGIAEAGEFITGENYHYDGSEKGLSKYLFLSFLFKNMKFLGFGGFPVPDQIDDYMFRALASVADLNWKDKSTDLLYLLGDKREIWTYEHNALVLVLLHEQKYSQVYNKEVEYYNSDKKYYQELLSFAPENGPSTDYSREDYHPFWSSSSRLNWPNNEGNRNIKDVLEYAGMDYMFLYNLYRLVFEPDNYALSEERENHVKNGVYEKFKKPNMSKIDASFFYMPPSKE